MILINLLQAVWTRAVAAETEASPTSYADDATILGTRAAVQEAGSVTLTFCAVTGQALNTKKFLGFDTSADATPLRFNDKDLPMGTVTRCLGANLTLSATAEQAPHVAERFTKALASLRRIGNLPLSFHERARMAQAQPCAAVMYGAETTDWTTSQVHAWEGALLSALWGGTRPNRCREAFFAVLLTGHRMDPSQALPFSRLCALARMVQQHPDLHPRLQTSLRLLRRRGCQPPAGRGPVSLALSAFAAVHWRWTPPWTISTPDAIYNLLSVKLPVWAHMVRDALRRCRLQPATARRTDMQGADQPLDLAATNHAWTSNFGGPLLSGTIRSVFTDSVWTEGRRFRARLAPSGACAHCPAATLEDTDHLFWDCTAWASIRTGFPALKPTTSQQLAPCLRICGLIPAVILPTHVARRELALALQSMHARILLAR